MANIDIDLLDICNELGGMKNAVEFINYYKNVSIKRLERFVYHQDYKNLKFNIRDFRVSNYKHPEISFKDLILRIIDNRVGFVNREIVIADAYNFLRNNTYTQKIIIEFKDMDPDGKMVDMYLDFKKKNEERKIKMKDVDPYGEEDWLEEKTNTKMITKFKVFDQFLNVDDPYNEEDWDEEYNIGDKLICQINYTIGCYPTTHRYKKGNEYEIIDVDDNRILIMSDTGKSHWEKKDCQEFKKTPPPFQRNYVPSSRNY